MDVQTSIRLSLAATPANPVAIVPALAAPAGNESLTANVSADDPRYSQGRCWFFQ